MGRLIDIAFRFDEDGAELPRRRVRSWHGVSAEAVHISDSIPLEYTLKSPTHYLALHDFQSSDVEIRVADLAPSHEKDIRGKLTFVPYGCEATVAMLLAAARP